MDEARSNETEEAPHILMAGDSGDVAEIRGILSLLPEAAYGQVFIEAVVPLQIVDIPAPRRVSVTWLVRDADQSDVPLARGELIRRAVTAWIHEWMPDHGHEQHGQHEHAHYYVWVGCIGSPRVRDLYHSLGRLFGFSPAVDDPAN